MYYINCIQCLVGPSCGQRRHGGAGGKELPGPVQWVEAVLQQWFSCGNMFYNLFYNYF